MDHNWSEIIQFIADLVGKLGALPELVVQKMRGKAQEIAGVVGTAILPRVHFLRPDFPFGNLFKPFDSDGDCVADEAATQNLVTKTKARVRCPTGTSTPVPSSS